MKSEGMFSLIILNVFLNFFIVKSNMVIQCFGDQLVNQGQEEFELILKNMSLRTERSNHLIAALIVTTIM